MPPRSVDVVSTCGALLHGRELFIPYAMSDSATSFATVSLDERPNGVPTSETVPDTGPTPEEILQCKEREGAIQQALGRLSHEHRSIIVLRDIEGFSYNEIADVLGISMGTVKSRIARARADLKKSLMRYLSVQHL